MLLTAEYKQQNYNIGIFILLISWFQSTVQILHTILYSMYIFYIHTICKCYCTIVLIFQIKN